MIRIGREIQCLPYAGFLQFYILLLLQPFLFMSAEGQRQSRHATPFYTKTALIYMWYIELFGVANDLQFSNLTINGKLVKRILHF